LPVISVRDMIAIKEKAGREQDLADIKHLRRLLEKSGE
jgi:predicted nucleotidyltransferase